MPRSAQSRASPGRRNLLKQATAAGLALLIPGSLGPADKARGSSHEDFAPGALRFDLRHSVANGVESFALQRLRFEQNGHRRPPKRAEDLGWGDYRLSVYDAGDRALIFRIGFDTTLPPDARSATTELSLRCPMPRRTIHALIERRRAQSIFQERWVVTVEPSDARIDRSGIAIAARADNILSNGTPETGVSIAVLGDGYPENQYRKFTADAARAAGYLFSVEPFRTRARDFNIYSVFSPSADSGVTDPYLALQKDTVFRCAMEAVNPSAPCPPGTTMPCAKSHPRCHTISC